MPAYAITVTCVVAVSSVIVFLIFYRMKLLNLKTLFSVTLASLVSALGLPAVFGLVSGVMYGDTRTDSPAITLLVSIACYLLIVAILSVVISLVINGAGTKRKEQDGSENAGDPDKVPDEADNYLEQIFVNFIGDNGKNTPDSQDSNAEAAETAEAPAITGASAITEAVEAPAIMEAPEITEILAASEESGLSKADALPDMETSGDDPGFGPSDTAGTPAGDNTASPGDEGMLVNFDENAATMENNLEISVDSNENIDKMGIENNVHNRNSLTIEDCINEAFRLKGTGDLESAILHYMYALDKKPGKELTFWIILDICVMYKSLGQNELALDILNSYYETYGDTMDVSLKDEISRNLAVSQA